MPDDDGFGAPPAFNPNPHPPAGATRKDGTPYDAPPATPGDRGADQFDRAYVEDLRQQAAGYRTQFAPYRDAFSPYTEEERQEWLDLAREFANNPTGAAARLRELANAVDPQSGPFEAAEAPKTEEAPADDKPLTRAEFAALLQADRQEQAQAARAAQAQAAQEAQVQGIYAEAEKLGYKSGTREIVDLLWVARNDPRAQGDLARAHQVIEYDRQESVRTYLREKGYDGRELPIPGGGGSAPSGREEIKDFSSARASLEARLSQL